MQLRMCIYVHANACGRGYTYIDVIFFQEYLKFVCTYKAKIFIYMGLHDVPRTSP